MIHLNKLNVIHICTYGSYLYFHKCCPFCRQEGQGSTNELRNRDFRKDLEERERASRDKRDRGGRGQWMTLLYFVSVQIPRYIIYILSFESSAWIVT